MCNGLRHKRIGLSDELFCFDCSREPPPLDDKNGDTDEQLVPTKPRQEPEPEPAVFVKAIPRRALSGWPAPALRRASGARDPMRDPESKFGSGGR